MVTAIEEITQPEIDLVSEAAPRFANQRHHDDPVDDLVKQWVEIVKPLARNSGWVSWPSYCAHRLFETYKLAYPELEEAGAIDGWGGSESRSVMCSLALSFADAPSLAAYVREAIEEAYEMGAGR
jgi:hypothetical protein